MTDTRPAQVIAADPKGLIRESYVIEGITIEECRSILIDWALSLPLGGDTITAAQVLLAQYGARQGGHPMTLLLTEALAQGARPKRRGGVQRGIDQRGVDQKGVDQKGGRAGQD